MCTIVPLRHASAWLLSLGLLCGCSQSTDADPQTGMLQAMLTNSSSANRTVFIARSPDLAMKWARVSGGEFLDEPWYWVQLPSAISLPPPASDKKYDLTKEQGVNIRIYRRWMMPGARGSFEGRWGYSDLVSANSYLLHGTLQLWGAGTAPSSGQLLSSEKAIGGVAFAFESKGPIDVAYPSGVEHLQYSHQQISVGAPIVGGK